MNQFTIRWPVRAVERFNGPWNHTLSTRVLVIGNTADPATPKRSALDTVELLGGATNAVFLEQAGVGHTSFAQTSACTYKIVTAYFTNGTVSLSDG